MLSVFNLSGGTAQSGRSHCSIQAEPLLNFAGRADFAERCTHIGFGLASNHAFIDGNKRIGAMVTQLLLKWNGYQFQLEQNELADMFIGIADGTKDETELRYWINDHIE